MTTEVTHYGDWFVGGELAARTSIHGSGTIDVQVDADTGEVVAVWFRCLSLPFRVSEVTRQAKYNPPVTVTAVEYRQEDQ